MQRPGIFLFEKKWGLRFSTRGDKSVLFLVIFPRLKDQVLRHEVNLSKTRSMQIIVEVEIKKYKGQVTRNKCYKELTSIPVRLKKKGESKGGKSHVRTMMHSEADEGFKMNAHHVRHRQIGKPEDKAQMKPIFF